MDEPLNWKFTCWWIDPDKICPAARVFTLNTVSNITARWACRLVDCSLASRLYVQRSGCGTAGPARPACALAIHAHTSSVCACWQAFLMCTQLQRSFDRFYPHRSYPFYKHWSHRWPAYLQPSNLSDLSVKPITALHGESTGPALTARLPLPRTKTRLQYCKCWLGPAVQAWKWSCLV